MRSYLSRAVTFEGLCAAGVEPDPLFEEDLRMILRTGAKFIGRSAMYSWSGNLSHAQIEQHFKLAKERAEIVHKADPEIILQAGIFEIAYRSTVNNTPIPGWVFEAFDLPPEERNFKYENVVFPKGHPMGPGAWGQGDAAAWPKIANIETQMYFYYIGTRYIDAGYEALHLGQVEKMMESKNINNAVPWDRVTTLLRQYAKTHARRGIVLCDGHSELTSAGMKVGNRLVMDIYPAAAVPNETKMEDGAMKAEVRAFDGIDPKGTWLSWVGRSGGGRHPLGFDIDNNFSIIELDNYGNVGKLGVATPGAFGNWGYDDIGWFAAQPEWYRNQFIKETDTYLRTHCLDKEGKQVYFFQPTMRRTQINPTTFIYKPGDSANIDFLFDFCKSYENIKIKFNAADGTFTLTTSIIYRANRQSDGCPVGAGQEDTIREIFLGKNAKEDPELLKVVLPPKYTAGSADPNTSSSSGGRPDSSRAASSAKTTASDTVSAVRSSETSDSSAKDESTSVNAAPSEGNTSSESGEIETGSKSMRPRWILGIVAGIIILLGGGGFAVWFSGKKKA